MDEGCCFHILHLCPCSHSRLRVPLRHFLLTELYSTQFPLRLFNYGQALISFSISLGVRSRAVFGGLRMLQERLTVYAI